MLEIAKRSHDRRRASLSNKAGGRHHPYLRRQLTRPIAEVPIGARSQSRRHPPVLGHGDRHPTPSSRVANLDKTARDTEIPADHSRWPANAERTARPASPQTWHSSPEVPKLGSMSVADTDCVAVDCRCRWARSAHVRRIETASNDGPCAAAEPTARAPTRGPVSGGANATRVTDTSSTTQAAVHGTRRATPAPSWLPDDEIGGPRGVSSAQPARAVRHSGSPLDSAS